MVNPRQKGARGETVVKELLRKHTGLPFERVPCSGALPYLKGDLYIPNSANKFCIEVKNYAESHFNDKLFTSKTNNFVGWWQKLVQQAENNNQEPLLFFKYNRSKIFVATRTKPTKCDRYMYTSWLDCYVMLAEDWLGKEQIKWLP